MTATNGRDGHPPMVFDMTLKPWQILWVPVGAIICEETVNGNLSFHLRMCFLPTDKESITSYKLYVDWCKHEKKKGVKYMEAALRHMEFTTGDDLK